MIKRGSPSGPITTPAEATTVTVTVSWPWANPAAAGPSGTKGRLACAAATALHASTANKTTVVNTFCFTMSYVSNLLIGGAMYALQSRVTQRRVENASVWSKDENFFSNRCISGRHLYSAWTAVTAPPIRMVAARIGVLSEMPLCETLVTVRQLFEQFLNCCSPE